MRLALSLAACAFCLFLGACGSGAEISLQKKAKIELVSQEMAPWFGNTPELFVTVKNSGDNTAYWVVVNVKAKDSAGVIVDTGIITPGDWGDIKPGEQAKDSAIMFDLDIDGKYSFEFDISWKDR